MSERNRRFAINDEQSERLLKEGLKRLEAKEREELPQPVTDLEVFADPFVLGGRNVYRIYVLFDSQSDPNFAAARIWMRGYGIGTEHEMDTDSLPWHLVTVVTSAPATFFLEQTGEEIVIGVEAQNFNNVGAGIDTMPTQPITLT